MAEIGSKMIFKEQVSQDFKDRVISTILSQVNGKLESISSMIQDIKVEMEDFNKNLINTDSNGRE